MASALVMLVGCGKPEFTFVANSDEKTYFKVPSGWAKIDERKIDSVVSGLDEGSMAAALHKTRLWSVAYDAAKQPSHVHMTSFVTTEAPVVYAAVQHLATAEQDVLSLDFMRNFYLPVTADLRARAERVGYPLTDFELLQDEVLTPSPGLHGVRAVFNYRFPTGVYHTFDQSVYANNDSSTLYYLLIRCTFTCYRGRKAEIDTVVESFTVRSPA
jgi:hypothetical protein